MSDLGFKELRSVNVKRCEAVFHKLSEWSQTDWACAMAGEAGEACNVVKKMRRLESADRKKDTPKERKRLNRELAKELADVVIYVDLLAARCDIDLGTAVIEKFNEVSKRRKTKIRIKG